MKFSLAALLPAAALALTTQRTTTNPRSTCTPGTYTCDESPAIGWGWAVCDTRGEWVRGGSCQAGEYCSMNPANNSPYCIPMPDDYECSPDLFQCVEDGDGSWYINDCQDGRWTEAVRCGDGEVCAYGAVNGYPYCTANPPW